MEEKEKMIKKPQYTPQEINSNIAYGMTSVNNITLCEDTTTSRLEWCDNNFLVLTKKEAQAKLLELQGEKK